MTENDHILESEEAFKIIKEIERDSHLTQRDLAVKLEISLGRINFIVNALINKGIIKAQNFKNSNRKLAYMYLLTPEGIRMKVRLIGKFLAWKTEQYERLRGEIESLRSESAVVSASAQKELP